MDQLGELNRFLGRAMLATYAGSGSRAATTQRPGFIELEYGDGPWYYRDSYAGFVRSVGHEVIWHKGKPFWSSIYGGGMTAEYKDNAEFADRTFTFLKKTMSTGEKMQAFQPRGPNLFTDGDWKYECRWDGDIVDFKGSEEISFRGKVVFTHDFRGGIIDWSGQNQR